MFFVGIASCRDELYVMLLWLRQECRSLLRLALPVLVVCSVGGVGMTGMPYLPNLCASVPICGRHISARRFCVFCVFCGNTLSACSVGAAETAAPPAGYRSPPDRIPFAVRSDSVRRPVGFRPPSNQIPFAVRSDSVRCPTTWCEEVNREDCAAIHSGFALCILLCSQN